MMKRLICAALSLAMLQTASFAANFNEVLIGGDVITYQGNAKENATVTFTVLKPDVTLDEFMVVDSGEIPICYREVKADADGKYLVTFDIGGISDTYNIYVGGTERTELDYIALRYINESENETARGLLFAENVDVAAVAKDNAKALGIRKSLTEKMDDELYAEAAAIYSASGEIENTLSSVTEAMEKAVGIALWNEDKTELFGDDTDALSIPETISIWYEKSYMTESVMENIADDTSKTSASFEDFDKAIAEATALAVIKHADGYGDVQKCLKDNADLLGISESKVTSAFCKSIVGNSYENIDDTNIDTFKQPSSSLGGGGGGGGGGSSSSKKDEDTHSTVAIEKVETQKPEPVAENKSAFNDMAGYDWALEAVNALYGQGVLSGKSEGCFAPGDVVTREEFAKMVMTAVKFETLAGEVEFDDVTVSDWYYDYVTQAYLCGVINGISENSFGSGMQITRQDMAVMCYNALVKKGVIDEKQEKTLNYTDAELISEYAQDAVGVLSSLKILTGNSENSFIPRGFASRAEAAQMIYKTLNYIGEI